MEVAVCPTLCWNPIVGVLATSIISATKKYRAALVEASRTLLNQLDILPKLHGGDIAYLPRLNYVVLVLGTNIMEKKIREEVPNSPSRKLDTLLTVWVIVVGVE